MPPLSAIMSSTSVWKIWYESLKRQNSPFFVLTTILLVHHSKPYTIIRRKGIKIGVFGIGPKLEGLVLTHNYGNAKYLDPAATALRVATMLKEQKKCDIVICISHLGWDLGGDDDNRMISHSRNIDLVLGGHSHTYFTELMYEKNLDGKPVPDDQNGKNAIYVGKLVLEFK